MKPTVIYSESELVLLLKKADTAAFWHLYRHYEGALYQVAYSILKDEEFASYALHDAFMKIWRNIHQYDPDKGRLFTWMHQIIKHKSLEILQSKTYKESNRIKSMTENDLMVPMQDSPEQSGLRSLLQYLKKEHRVLIELSYFAGYTRDEIAAKLNIPVGTVKTRIRAALVVLRKMMQLF